jgi:hypothetical protein
MAYAVADAAEKRQKNHAIECPNCRKTIKVSVAQMKRFVPATPPAEETADRETDVVEQGDEEREG